MSCEILEFVKTLCYFRFLTRARLWSVVQQHEAGFAGGRVYEVSIVGRLEGRIVERGQEPVCELEIVGCVRCDSANQLSEVLWIRTITPCRTQLRGLAHCVRTITDFLLSLSLWVSWVLLSLGKLVISLFWTKIVVAFSGLFLVVCALESLGIARRFSSESSFGLTYRSGSSQEISLRLYR